MGLDDADVLMATGGKSDGDPVRLIGDGIEVSLDSVGYACQEREGRIAEALLLSKCFAISDPACGVLGNTPFEKGVEEEIRDFAGGVCLFLEYGTRYRTLRCTRVGGRLDTEDHRDRWNLRAPTRWAKCTSTTAGSPASSSSWGLSVRERLEVADATTPVSGGMR